MEYGVWKLKTYIGKTNKNSHPELACPAPCRSEAFGEGWLPCAKQGLRIASI